MTESLAGEAVNRRRFWRWAAGAAAAAAVLTPSEAQASAATLDASVSGLLKKRNARTRDAVARLLAQEARTPTSALRSTLDQAYALDDLDSSVAGYVQDQGSQTHAALSAAYADIDAVADAMHPIDRCYSIPPTMIAQANAAGHGWVAGSGNRATLNLNDTTYSPFGAQSVKITTNGSGRIDRTGLSLDMTGKSPVLWFMVEDTSTLDNIYLYLGDNRFANYFVWQLAPKQNGNNEFQNGEFVKVALNWGDATVSGSPNRATLTAARFYVEDRLTGPATVHFSGLAAQAEPTTRYPKGVVVYTFDDGRISQYTGARPTLDKFGFPGTAYVIAQRIDSDNGRAWMTTQMLKNLQNQSGWEVGVHSNSQTLHDQLGGFTAATEGQLVADLTAAKRWLTLRGLRGGDQLAYPRGLYDATVLDTVRRFCSSARTTWGKRYDTWPPADPYRLRTKMLQAGEGATLGDLKAAVDVTVANRGLLVITGHALGTTADSITWVQSDFDALVGHVAKSGAAVRTVSQMLRGE